MPGDATVAAAGASLSSGNTLVDVRIVDRPEETAGLARLRLDKAAAGYLEKHARFAQLEDLADSIERSPDFEDLRMIFPQRMTHNPNLLSLTNHALEVPDEFRSA